MLRTTHIHELSLYTCVEPSIALALGGLTKIRKVSGGIADNILSDSDIEGIIGQNTPGEKTTVGRIVGFCALAECGIALKNAVTVFIDGTTKMTTFRTITVGTKLPI